MKAKAAESTGQIQPHIVASLHRRATYQRVFDERKRAIRGLWVRNGRYYAQLTIEDEETGEKTVRRVPLEGATSPSQARAKMEALKVDRGRGLLPVLRRTPLFADYAKQYLEFYGQAKDAKRASTLETESYAIDRWCQHLGQVRLDKITRALVNSFIAKRQGSGKSARTVNLEVTIFRNVMNRAVDDKWITRLPTENLRPLKVTKPKRLLTTAADLERLCTEALSTGQSGGGRKVPVYQNGQEFADYVRLMCYCGSRMTETLHLKWVDVDWQRRQLAIGADGLSKNGQTRHVDFNPKLEAHLKEMAQRCQPDSQWMFPSPRRGDEDRPAKTFVETLRLVRKSAQLPDFGFHDCRHFFISMCVMSGIDYMTIARWVGHQDGGVLIGKVYGHLSNEHAQRQAQKVVFTPAVLDTDGQTGT